MSTEFRPRKLGEYGRIALKRKWMIILPTLAIGLAMFHAFGAARRLGALGDTPDRQSELARSILRDHLVCLAAMSTLLATQLVGG